MTDLLKKSKIIRESAKAGSPIMRKRIMSNPETRDARLEACRVDAQKFADSKKCRVAIFVNYEGTFITREAIYCEPGIEVIEYIEPKMKKTPRKELF